MFVEFLCKFVVMLHPMVMAWIFLLEEGLMAAVDGGGDGGANRYGQGGV